MTQDKYFATGRGGYGNVRKGDPKDTGDRFSPSPVPENKTVSTGRGGAGNMRAHKAADDETMSPQVSAKSPSLMPVASPTIGRGGYGNVKAGQHSAASLFSRAKDMFKKE